MPMMRRGPLDRYPAEWVLRQASAHQVTGSVEFHTSVPATAFFQNGRLYATELGVGPHAGDEAPVHVDEAAAREQAILLLGQTLEREGGWYYHDPLGVHPAQGSWAWEVATVLMDVRSRVHEDQTLAAWADRKVVLQQTTASSITLSADAWAIVVSLSEAATATEVRSRLGWQPDRLLDALTEIGQRGALDPVPGRPAPSADPQLHHAPAAAAAPGTAPVPPAGPSTLERAMAENSARSRALRPVPEPVITSIEPLTWDDDDAGAASRHTGPLTPPPPLQAVAGDEDARGGRRRRLPGRKTV